MPARILVIEDNAANLDLMVYLLRAFGHPVLSARDGEEGLATAGREKPDLIVCDIQLPKMDGYEVVRRLKADPACRSIPVVAVTALAMVGDRDRVLDAGFEGYLAKPITPETFVQQIEGFLSSTRSYPPSRFADPLPEAARHSIRLGKVLVVDNVQANLDLACSILEPSGYEVTAASGAREGLEKADRHPPDLILSDVCMSEGSGYDFIRAVKANTRLAGIPFVFITSSMLEEKDRERGLALGAARFLFRPIEPQELLAEIEACLREVKPHVENIDRG